MVESGWWRAARAAVIVVVLLASTSVVLWPIAVLGLPLLFWAACGGRLAQWSASIVAASVAFVGAELSGWMLVQAVTGDAANASRWLFAFGVAVALVTLAAFAVGTQRVHDRRSADSVATSPRPGLALR